jgi:hypothetical protein
MQFSADGSVAEVSMLIAVRTLCGRAARSRPRLAPRRAFTDITSPGGNASLRLWLAISPYSRETARLSFSAASDNATASSLLRGARRSRSRYGLRLLSRWPPPICGADGRCSGAMGEGLRNPAGLTLPGAGAPPPPGFSGRRYAYESARTSIILSVAPRAGRNGPCAYDKAAIGLTGSNISIFLE